jgi:UDP-N-acetylglucosamine--N-acetylmuramyl-(pentapeptide) pyrophosphoryl-undecaprenol N-acetylglucosamine transferase
MDKKINKVIISGGGTGGHIFPAISIANAIHEKDKNIEILFVGAEGKMEMEKVPNAGYKIIGLPVRGFKRELSLENISFFWKLYQSMRKAKKIIKDFKPDIAIGVGGFASGPLLKTATKFKIPSIIQEQNSYAGVTNKILGNKVNKICVAYDNMEQFFPIEKIVKTGNPVRIDLIKNLDKKVEALKHFNLLGNTKTVLIIGGSLGARTINNCLKKDIKTFVDNNIQVIWQTGKLYYKESLESAKEYLDKGIVIYDFISRMDYAYAIADVVISRAGASTVSELCLVKKPTIFVPSPNVAEDHQTKNAMALINKDAAMMIEDSLANRDLVKEAVKLIRDDYRMKVYSENIGLLGIPNSAQLIVDEVYKVFEKSVK